MGASRILLYRARDLVEAHFLAQALESAGVAAAVSGGNSLLYGVAGGAEVLSADVWIDARDAERGRAVIERWRQGAARGAAGQSPGA